MPLHIPMCKENLPWHSIPMLTATMLCTSLTMSVIRCQEGFILPLFVTCIGRNGAMVCGQYDDIEATGLDFIFEASHIEGEAFLVPMHMLVVDQRGEAAHVRCDGEGTQDIP